MRLAMPWRWKWPPTSSGRDLDLFGRFLQQQQVGPVAADKAGDILHLGANPPQQIRS